MVAPLSSSSQTLSALNCGIFKINCRFFTRWGKHMTGGLRGIGSQVKIQLQLGAESAFERLLQEGLQCARLFWQSYLCLPHAGGHIVKSWACQHFESRKVSLILKQFFSCASLSIKLSCQCKRAVYMHTGSENWSPKNIHKRIIWKFWYKHTKSYTEGWVYTRYSYHHNDWLLKLQVVS